MIFKPFWGSKKIFDFLVVEKFVLRKMKKKIRKNTFFFNFFHFSQGKFLYHQKIWKFFWPSKSLKNHFKIILKQKKNFFFGRKIIFFAFEKFRFFGTICRFPKGFWAFGGGANVSVDAILGLPFAPIVFLFTLVRPSTFVVRLLVPRP